MHRHAPVWITMVSGLTGEPPVSPAVAKRRLRVLALYLGVQVAVIAGILIYQAVT